MAENGHQQINWRSRIVKRGTIKASEITPHPNNPRKHPQLQRDAVEASFDELGQIAPIVLNVNNGYLVDGEERSWLALAQDGDVDVEAVWVDLTEEEHLKALAYFDATGDLATYDTVQLDVLLQSVNSDNAAIQEMLAGLAESAGLYSGDEVEEKYSRKVDIPIYEPSDKKPEISELYDDTKTNELLTEIQALNELSEAERSFLTLAASRHIVFNYAKIADLYAHGSADLQRLMENSALVIIDFNRAIELGYVKLTQEIADMVSDEND